MEPSKQEWNAHSKKKGKRKLNKRMNKVKETKNFDNRFSRLQAMTEDVNEVAELLRKTVKEQNNANNWKEKKENENEYEDKKCMQCGFCRNKQIRRRNQKYAENDQSNEESMNNIAKKINIEDKKTCRKTLTIVRK